MPAPCFTCGRTGGGAPPADIRSLAFRYLVALPPVQDLLLCAKHLLVAAMVVGVHGPATNRQSEHDGRAVRIRSREVFNGAKAKRRPPLIGKSTSYISRPAPQDLSLCAKHLFVAAMVSRACRGRARFVYDGDMTADN